MTDRDMLVYLCGKLGLSKAEFSESYNNLGGTQWSEGTASDGRPEIQIGAGRHGYSGFYATFKFDDDGNIVEHGCFE